MPEQSYRVVVAGAGFGGIGIAAAEWGATVCLAPIRVVVARPSARA